MHTSIDWIIEGQEVYSVGPEATVLDAARFMAERKIGAVSVLDNDRLIGIISERDLMTKVVAEGLDPKTTLVRDVMSRRLVHGSRGDTHAACIEKMLRHNCRHLPIIDGERVVGMLSIRDLYRVEASEKAEEIEELTAYMYSSPKVAKGST